MGLPKTRLIVACLVSLVVLTALSFYLRFLPCSSAAGTFVSDAAFHYRMTEYVWQNGNLPELDRLALFPLGKKVAEFLPAGMYYLGAFFVRVLEQGTEWSSQRALMVFYSLFGSLSAVVLFFCGLALYRDFRAALFVSLAIAITPVHLVRTSCYWFRPEGIGITLVTIHWLCALLALRGTGSSRVILWSCLSVLAFAASFSVWRPALTLLPSYAAIAVLLVIIGRATGNLMAWFLILSGVSCLFFATMRYAVSQGVLTSKMTLFAAAASVALFTDWVMRRRGTVSPGRGRMIALLCGCAALAAGWRFFESGGYGSLFQLVVHRLGALRGVAPDPGGILRAYLNVRELSPLGFFDLFDLDKLSFLGLAFLTVPVWIILEAVFSRRISLSSERRGASAPRAGRAVERMR